MYLNENEFRPLTVNPMKLTIVLILLILTSGAGYSQNSLTITGYAPHLKNGSVVSIELLQPRRFFATANKKESAIVKKNRFAFKLKTSGEFYNLIVDNKAAMIFLGPGRAIITIQDSALKNVKIADNLASAEYKMFGDGLRNDELFMRYIQAKNDYYLNSEHLDSATMTNKKLQMDSLLSISNREVIKFSKLWIQNHQQSFINSYIILRNLLDKMPEADIKTLFQNIPESVKKNSFGKELQYYIDSLFIQGKAPAFVQMDTGDKKISLASFMGRYVLIDFWASWCVPCRADNPNLVKVLKTFRNKNFAILSISLDTERDAWLKAIKEDGMTWTNLSDLKAFKNEVSNKYNVYAIPENFLIDPQGIIIGKGLHGEDLLNILEKLIQ